jgi:electron-transferring-flavoprotein dehydrogenase
LSSSPKGRAGSLTKQLISKFDLAKNANPQTYGVGVKELWEVPAGRIAAGEVIYTMGWPLTTHEYGGAWIYGSKGDGSNNVVSLGFVTGLDYADPRLDPQRVLQEFKRHPFVAKLLEGGKMIRYGAKSMPYGGWWAIPPVAGRRLDDPRRFCRLPEFGAAERNSSGDQERDARSRDGVRCAD